MIIKAQRELSGGSTVMIYNKDRSLFQMLESDVLMTALGDRYKAYFEAEIDDNGLLRLKREVKAKW